MIKMFDYLRIYREIEDEIIGAVRTVFESGRLVLGPETAAFEAEFADFVGARHCVAVSSGTTALQIALMTLGIGSGDEVVTVANTCVPTVAAIRLTGATPVFVDVRDDDLMMDAELIESVISPRTKCVMPVHLWGDSVDMKPLMDIAGRRELRVVEDCAQAHGTLYDGRHAGNFGDAGCFSFYPTKNLGAYGEGGAIVANDEALANNIRKLRTYGYKDGQIAVTEGMNGRISELQAAILRVKLRKLPEWLRRRRQNAALYDKSINHPDIKSPLRNPQKELSFHQYVIRSSRRGEIISLLQANNIGCAVHYPIPVHLMPAYKGFGPEAGLPATEKSCDEILSIPVHEAMTAEEVETVARTLNSLP